MHTIDIPVVAVAGRGFASKEMKSHLERGELQQALGTKIFAGSLNLISKTPLRMNEELAVMTSKRILQKAMLNSTPVVVARWNKCPLHVFEVVHPTRLRDNKDINEAKTLVLSLNAEQWTQPTTLEMMIWMSIWKQREKWFYTQDAYAKIRLKATTQNHLRTPTNPRQGERFDTNPFAECQKHNHPINHQSEVFETQIPSTLTTQRTDLTQR